MRRLLAVAALSLGLPGCMGPRSPGAMECRPGTVEWWTAPAAVGDDDARCGGERAATVARKVILFVPNRLVDLLDVVRAGVNVGPGGGMNVRLSESSDGTFLNRCSVGVGFQGLRHSPVCASVEKFVRATGPWAWPAKPPDYQRVHVPIALQWLDPLVFLSYWFWDPFGWRPERVELTAEERRDPRLFAKNHPDLVPAWYESPGDLRLEIHIMIVGFHAAFEPVEFVDFLAGFVGIDVNEDDF